MSKKICITFPDSAMTAIKKYEEKYRTGNTPDAIKQIVNRYLVEVEGL